MADDKCSKCRDVLDYIARIQTNPPAGITWEAEKPLDDILEEIKRIIKVGTILEQAAAKATTTGNHKDLHKYLKIRRIQ